MDDKFFVGVDSEGNVILDKTQPEEETVEIQVWFLKHIVEMLSLQKRMVGDMAKRLETYEDWDTQNGSELKELLQLNASNIDMATVCLQKHIDEA